MLEGGRLASKEAEKSRSNVIYQRKHLFLRQKSKKQRKSKSDFCFAVVCSQGRSTHGLLGIWV